MYNSTFSDRLKKLATLSGKSLNQIERELGYSRNALNNYKYNRVPSAKRLIELSDYFGVPPSYMFGKIDEKVETFAEDFFIN